MKLIPREAPLHFVCVRISFFGVFWMMTLFP